MQNLISNLKNEKKEDNLEVVVYSSSTITESKVAKEGDKLSDEQDFYIQNNSHVSEEELSNAIVNSIVHEILNEGMERLPRVIFYFNLYLPQSLYEKKRIDFTAKEKGYGFEEADGIFYSKSDTFLNKNGGIPFLQKMRFILSPFSKDPIYVESGQNSQIEIKKNSLIYMEVKASFPLKYENNQKHEKILKGFVETKSLIQSILRKAKKFSEIVIYKKKYFNTIHILFLYNSILQTNDDMQNYIEEFKKIFNVTIKVGL